MVVLRYRDEHNKVGYLLKPTGSDDYHQIIDFLRASHIRSPELGPPAIQATIDKTPYTITKDLVRSRLQLADDGGIDDLPIAEIYSRMDNLGTKSDSWDQFGSPIVVALICLSDGRRFNWSSYIFKDPNTASFSRSHETDDGPFTNVEDEPLGASFHMSPPRSTQAPPAGQHSGGAEDPITLTALSSVVSTLVVRKLVKKVKSLEVKLRTKKRRMVVSYSNKEEGRKQDVDFNAIRTLANVAVTVDSNIPPGGPFNTPAASTSVPADVLTGASFVPIGSLSVPPDVPPSVAPAGMEEDRLGEEAAKRLHDKEQAQMDRQREELQRRRQQEVLGSTMYYTKADWIHIMAQVEANLSLSKTLLGDDVTEDNFPARMAALIKRKKQALAEKLAKERRNRLMTQAQQRAYMRQYVKNQSSAIYTTGWSMAYVKSFTDDQLKEEFEKIRKDVSTEDSDDEAPPVWYALVCWEVILTPLETVSGEVLYMFADVFYPLSVKLMEKILRYKLDIDKDVVGNDMSTVEQLIQFIKNQLAAAQNVAGLRFPNDSSMLLTFGIQCCWFEFKYADAAFSRDIPLTMYVVPTGRVVVPTGRYVVHAVEKVVGWCESGGDGLEWREMVGK
nr:JmjC domain-containing protein [Tanacetum cinerariifolium]